MPRQKYDAVIEAVHYLADGKIDHVRFYERRGAVWSDRLMLSRAMLLEGLQKGKRFVTGQRQPYYGSQLIPGQSVRMLKNVITTESQAGNHDLLSGVPVI
jgi:hypothetical protein